MVEGIVLGVKGKSFYKINFVLNIEKVKVVWGENWLF